ncbi:MAG: Fur family transcriptional regulator [Oligoflexales bacterium]
MSLDKSLDQVIAAIEKICKKDGVKFTPRRKDIFKIMLRAKKALSAYEVSHLLNQEHKTSTPTMSVYRILDFLEKQKFVHKISSINKYAVCGHITCRHGHDLPRLAVCTSCLKVEELAMNNPIKQELQVGLESIDFHMESQQLELMGLCSDCKNC